MLDRKMLNKKMIPVFSKYLREYREENKLTQKALAKKLMITDRQFRNLELGTDMPNALTLSLFLLLLDKEKQKVFLAELREAIES